MKWFWVVKLNTVIFDLNGFITTLWKTSMKKSDNKLQKRYWRNWKNYKLRCFSSSIIFLAVFNQLFLLIKINVRFITIFVFRILVKMMKNEKISCTVFAWKWQPIFVTLSPKLTKNEKWKMTWTGQLSCKCWLKCILYIVI